MLTEAACRSAAPREREYKLTDSGGLFLRVKPSGSKSWCWKYRFGGCERRLTIGRYPAVSLKDARSARDSARDRLERGTDPSIEKKRRRAARRHEALDSFEKIARAWHEQKAPELTPRYAAHILARLENDVFPAIGSQPIGEIAPPDMLDIGRTIQARGATDLAHRVVNHASEVFVWAIASGLCSQDPAGTIGRALKPHSSSRRPALVSIEEARAILRLTEGMTGAHWSTLLASRLIALTAARPGVVRLAEPGEFEGLGGEAPLWRIPAAKMKLSAERKRDASFDFVVPLSRQAAAVAAAAIGATRSSRWLFTGPGSFRTPISDSTLSKLYRDAGLTGRHVPHGWRSSFSTAMNERAALEERDGDRAIIDLMLAHVRGGVEPIYNRAAYMPRRREIAQAWADLLMAGLPPPEALLPANRLGKAAQKPGEPGHDGRGGHERAV